jgi:hypothetical protein
MSANLPAGWLIDTSGILRLPRFAEESIESGAGILKTP